MVTRMGVSAAAGSSSGGMTIRLDRLEQRGLIEHRPDPADRRGVLIHLTRQGRSTIDTTLDAMLHVERETVAGAIPNRADRARLVELLRQVLVAFEHPEHAGTDDLRSQTS